MLYNIPTTNSRIFIYTNYHVIWDIFLMLSYEHHSRFIEMLNSSLVPSRISSWYSFPIWIPISIPYTMYFLSCHFPHKSHFPPRFPHQFPCKSHIYPIDSHRNPMKKSHFAIEIPPVHPISTELPCPRCCVAWPCSGAPRRCARRPGRCSSAGRTRRCSARFPPEKWRDLVPSGNLLHSYWK